MEVAIYGSWCEWGSSNPRLTVTLPTELHPHVYKVMEEAIPSLLTPYDLKN